MTPSRQVECDIVQLCMFHPSAQPMERGWVGRIDGDRVVHLAAQTLQSFFLGGGGAREHAEYPLAHVVLLAPVLYPPTVRIFEADGSFTFANASAIVGPGAAVLADGPLRLEARLAAVIGAGGAIAGYTGFADWRTSAHGPPKDGDFALGLGPVVVTVDAFAPEMAELRVAVDGDTRLTAVAPQFSWPAARDLAAAGTTLRPGDILAGPSAGDVPVAGAQVAELAVDGIGRLDHPLVGA